MEGRRNHLFSPWGGPSRYLTVPMHGRRQMGADRCMAADRWGPIDAWPPTDGRRWMHGRRQMAADQKESQKNIHFFELAVFASFFRDFPIRQIPSQPDFDETIIFDTDFPARARISNSQGHSGRSVLRFQELTFFRCRVCVEKVPKR